MIKINELRIGNYLSLMGEPFQVSEIKNSLQEVELCRKNSKNQNLNDYEESDLEHYDLKPIPLTQDHFKRAGCKDDNGTFWFDRLDHYIDFIYSLGSYYPSYVMLPEMSCEEEQRVCLKSIDFLHELQNLMFTLEGVELVFSTEP
jgi:hypothetical protein